MFSSCYLCANDDESEFLTSSNSQLPEPIQKLVCPVTLELYRDPILASDGHQYDYDAFINFFLIAKKNGTNPISPLTREVLTITGRYDTNMRVQVAQFRSERYKYLMKKQKYAPEPLSEAELFMLDDDRQYSEELRKMPLKMEFQVELPKEEVTIQTLMQANIAENVSQLIELMGLKMFESALIFETEHNGWSLRSLKQAGSLSEASLLVLEFERKVDGSQLQVGAFNRGPWRTAHLKPYGKEGFVFSDTEVFKAPTESAHMETKQDSIDYGFGALRIEDNFQITSSSSSIYGSPMLFDENKVELRHVRLYAWRQTSNFAHSVMDDPRFAAERMMIRIGMFQKGHDRHHFG